MTISVCEYRPGSLRRFKGFTSVSNTKKVMAPSGLPKQLPHGHVFCIFAPDAGSRCTGGVARRSGSAGFEIIRTESVAAHRVTGPIVLGQGELPLQFVVDGQRKWLLQLLRRVEQSRRGHSRGPLDKCGNVRECRNLQGRGRMCACDWLRRIRVDDTRLRRSARRTRQTEKAEKQETGQGHNDVLWRNFRPGGWYTSTLRILGES